MKFAPFNQAEEDSGLPMAPMIDIVFLLLIFFVSTSVFYRLEAEMDIDIPTASEAQVSRRTSREIIINVEEDGSIIVNQRELTIDQLGDILERLAKVNPEQSVIVRGDARTRHQDIMNILNECSLANIWNVSFAALEPTTEN